MGRSRGGLTSKIHALVDNRDLPVRLALSPGEAHDNRLAGLADRGYDADWIRERHEERRMGNIPPKSNRRDPICFSPYLYRARNRVERFFIGSSNAVGSRHATISSPPTTLLSSSLHPFGCGWLRVYKSAP